MKFSERIKNLGTENAFEVLAEVKKLETQGKDIISFAIGEPDFNTPENIKSKGKWAIEHNFTHYAPSAGLFDLRETIAKHISKLNQMDVSAENVVVTPGAKPVIFHTILSLIEPGDEVIYPNPGFPIYESVIRFVGGVPVPITPKESREFSINPNELEALITEKTKLIILNSPHNPTGGVIKREDLEKIAELAIMHDLWVLSDEIYSNLIYEEKFTSISSFPKMKERTIILNGFSKTYAMTGWRIGYGVMNAQLAQYMERLITNSDSCVATFTQLAAIEALNGPQNEPELMVNELKERRNLIVEELNKIEGIHCLLPRGAFYIYPNVTELCRILKLGSAKELQQLLLYEGNVAVLPDTSFGMKDKSNIEQYLRFSFATSKENIQAGINRIKRVIEDRKELLTKNNN